MVNEIAGKLDVREEVKNFCIKHQPIELKAGDKVFIREDLEDGKKYRYGYRFFKRTMKTGENVVESFIVDLIKIEGDIHNRYTSDMIDWEQTAILNAVKAPNFDNLVDKAVKAVRDYVAIITHLELDNITIESINYDLLSPLEIYREDTPEKIQKAIDWIDSLYTETFVIDDVSDVLNCKGGDRLVFSNGVEGEFLKSYFGGLRAEILFLDSGKCCDVPVELLKGATVTQKRGK